MNACLRLRLQVSALRTDGIRCSAVLLVASAHLTAPQFVAALPSGADVSLIFGLIKTFHRSILSCLSKDFTKFFVVV